MAELFDSSFPVAAAIAVAAGIVRGFAGFGSAMLMVPSMSALYTPQVAVPMLAVMEFAMGLQLAPRAVRHASARIVGALVVGGLLGLPLGALILALVPATPMRWAISAMILLAVGLLALGVGRKGPPKPKGSFATGTVSGFTIGATGVGAPPLVLYFLAGRDPAAAIRATMICFFLFAAGLQGVVYAVNGLLTWPVALKGAVLVPAFALGALAGSRLFGRATDRTYRRLALALVAVVAVVSPFA